MLLLTVLGVIAFRVLCVLFAAMVGYTLLLQIEQAKRPYPI